MVQAAATVRSRCFKLQSNASSCNDFRAIVKLSQTDIAKNNKRNTDMAITRLWTEQRRIYCWFWSRDGRGLPDLSRTTATIKT
jgi:hypothetical protein